MGVSKIAQFVAAHAIRVDATWHLAAHAHSFHELIAVERGRLRVELGGAEYCAHPGGLLLYPSGVTHEEWAEGSVALATTCLVFQYDGFAADEPILRHDDCGRVGMMASWLLDAQSAYFPDSQVYRQSLFEMLLAEFVRLTAQQPNAMIDKIRAYIRQHMADDFSLDNLAAEAGMSKFHFVRQYKALTGRSPMEDVRILRVEEARRLILSTSLTLCDIAPRVGIANGHHLSRLMKAYIGCGIRELRQAGR